MRHYASPRYSVPRVVIAPRILNRLRLAAGGLVTTEELIEAAYWDREDGGPETAANTIRNAIMQLRRLGYPVRYAQNGRYQFSPTIWEIDYERAYPSRPRRVRLATQWGQPSSRAYCGTEA